VPSRLFRLEARGTTDTAELLGAARPTPPTRKPICEVVHGRQCGRVGEKHASNRQSCRCIAPTTFWSSSASNGEHEAARCWSRGHSLHWSAVGDWPTTSRQPGGGQEAETEAARHVVSPPGPRVASHVGDNRPRPRSRARPDLPPVHPRTTPLCHARLSAFTVHRNRNKVHATSCSLPSQRRSCWPRVSATIGQSVCEHGERGVGQRCFKNGSLRNRQGGPARGPTPARNPSTGRARRAA
jgi:hypothetical protein